MKELKTLKDLGFTYYGDKRYRDDELKQEAIKWVKWIRKYNCSGSDEDFIFSFFNLTEEDLKGEKKE
jgi:hypothetical protein